LESAVTLHHISDDHLELAVRDAALGRGAPAAVRGAPGAAGGVGRVHRGDAYNFGREEIMSDLADAIGRRRSQSLFLHENENFAHEYLSLRKLGTELLIWRPPPPPQEQVEIPRKPLEDDPARIAFEDRIATDLIIFFLGNSGFVVGRGPVPRAACDNFGDARP
jgi:hypothetical protein